MERIIVEEYEEFKDEEGHKTAGTTTRLIIEGKKVIFESWTIACDEADDWHACGSFPIEAYKKGIQELIEKGRCLIEGTDLSETGSMGRERLELTKVSDNLIEFYCHGLQRGEKGYFNCDVNKLVLKEESPRREKDPPNAVLNDA